MVQPAVHFRGPERPPAAAQALEQQKPQRLLLVAFATHQLIDHAQHLRGRPSLVRLEPGLGDATAVGDGDVQEHRVGLQVARRVEAAVRRPRGGAQLVQQSLVLGRHGHVLAHPIAGGEPAATPFAPLLRIAAQAKLATIRRTRHARHAWTGVGSGGRGLAGGGPDRGGDQPLALWPGPLVDARADHRFPGRCPG